MRPVFLLALGAEAVTFPKGHGGPRLRPERVVVERIFRGDVGCR